MVINNLTIATIVCSALSDRPDLLIAINMELRRVVLEKDNTETTGKSWTQEEKRLFCRSEILNWIKISAAQAIDTIKDSV